MRHIKLSDHAADQLAGAAARRQEEFEAAYRVYDEALAGREARLAGLRRSIADAWRTRRLAAILGLSLEYAVTRLWPGPRSPKSQGPGRDEAIWTSGSEGERGVAEALSSQLSDEWTLISGYRNAKGEIDQLLIGPSGVMAIEVKAINGVVHCDGDAWWRDKYDKYGNLVETRVAIADKAGRGPSRQLNEPADLLQTFLTKRASLTRVYRAVVLAHERSRLGTLRDVAVDEVSTLPRFAPGLFLERSGDKLNAQAVERVVQLIRQDHAYHAKRPRHAPTR